MSAPRIQIIIGSTRDNRRGETVGRWFASVAAARDDLECELVDLREWDLPFLSSAKPPAAAPPTDPLIARWADSVAGADGYVLVTPEYNHGYPASLKNALDLVYQPWNRKPCAFVGYGGPGGGYRAVEQLRLVVVELEMVPLRKQVGIPGVSSAFDEAGAVTEPRHERAANGLLDDLAWWATVLRAARAG